MIKLKAISKQYGKKDQIFSALSDISCTIAKGESVAIVGKSGSGKSTLMHIMSGLDRPTSGEVIINGINIATLSGKKIDEFRAQKMGFIFQSFFIQPQETCLQNVMLPLEIIGKGQSERINKATAALERVDLGDKLQQKAGNLSGGQKQRLAIARAIVHTPPILFADEPTGNLDSVSGENIENILFSLSKEQKTTLIIVTHDSELASKCDRQVYLHDGKISKINQKSKAVT